jgi:hypothetical protein
MLASALPRLTTALRPLLARSCSHRKGCGGIKGAVRRIQRSLPRARHVARFDVAAYYNSITRKSHTSYPPSASILSG